MRHQPSVSEEEDPSRFKYDVFVSYRTGLEPDKTAGTTVQKVLERYPIPWGLRKNIVAAGLRSRLKVCRDITDFVAASDLDEAIRARLKQSRWLVVVCTPNTPESDYVAEEIRLFQEYHGAGRILPLLVAGEPRDSCPAKLLSTAHRTEAPDEDETDREPLAADVRADDLKGIVDNLWGRGIPKSEQARFKLLAPILGCDSPDDLVHRHRARTKRRVRVSVFCTLLLVCVVALWNSPWGQIYQCRTGVRRLSNEISDSTALSYIAGDLAVWGEVEEAEQIAERISPPGDTGALEDISEVLAKAEQYDRAVKAAQAISRPGNQQASLHRVAQVCAQRGEIGRAIQVAQGMSDSHSEKAFALLTVAKTAAEMGKKSQASEILDQVTEIPPKHVLAIGVLRTAATVYARIGDFDKAERVIQHISDPRHRAFALLNVSKIAVTTDSDLGIELLERAIQIAPREPYVFGVLADGAVHVGDATNQESWLSQVVELASDMRDPKKKAWALAAIAKSVAQTGHLDQAMEVGKLIEDAGARAGAIFRILEVAREQKKTGHVAPMLQHIGSDVEEIADPADRARAFCQLAAAAEKNDQATRSNEYLRNAIEAIQGIENHRERVRVLTQVAGAAAEMGDGKSATRLLEQTINAAYATGDPGYTVMILKDAFSECGPAIARDSSDAGSWTRVCQLAGHTGWSDELLYDLTKAAAKSDHPERALQAAQGIQSDEWRAGGLRAVAAAWSRLGYWRRARKTAKLNTTREGEAMTLAVILRIWAESEEVSLTED